MTYVAMLYMFSSLIGALANSNYFRKLLAVIDSINSEVTLGVSLQFDMRISYKWYGILLVNSFLRHSSDLS